MKNQITLTELEKSLYDFMQEETERKKGTSWKPEWNLILTRGKYRQEFKSMVKKGAITVDLKSDTATFNL